MHTAPGAPSRSAQFPRPVRFLAPWLLIGALMTLLAACDSGSRGSSPDSGGVALGAAPTVAVPPAAQDVQQAVVNVIRTVQPSVVEVQSSGGQGEAIGSGEILTADGYIVTNDHVVSGFSTFAVQLSNGKTLPARLVGAAPGDDLAVLKIDQKGLPPINVADSSKVAVGEFAIAIGSPLGLQRSATLGIVSALDRIASEGQGGPAQVLTGLIQTSAPINPGNSGGALVDLQGRLIGIPTLGAANPDSGVAANGIGFAIASNRVKFVTSQLIKNGRLINTGQGFLGGVGRDVTPQDASAFNLPVQSGLLVTGFTDDASGKSPAQTAGIQMGDIIIAVNGQPVATSGDLSGILVNLSPGTQVTLTVARGSGRPDIKVKLGEKPVS